MTLKNLQRLASTNQRRCKTSIRLTPMEAIPCNPKPQEEVIGQSLRKSNQRLSNQTSTTCSIQAKTGVATKTCITMSERRKANKRLQTPSRSTSMKLKLLQARFPATIQKSQVVVLKKESRQRIVLVNPLIGLQPKNLSQTLQLPTQNPFLPTLQQRE